MFPRLEQEGGDITNPATIAAILDDSMFRDVVDINVLPLIYDEKKQRCNILVFDFAAARAATARIARTDSGSGRKHPVYRFYDADGEYICEVRYGGATANALQRGLWTHTRNADSFFNSVTGGWIDYSHNHVLVKLFSHALVASETGHSSAFELIRNDIERLKKNSGL